jgi:hypothetical protein
MSTPVRSRVWLDLVVGIFAVSVASCATLPPRAADQSLKSIAGEWESVVNTPERQMKGTDSIREDGTDVWTAGEEKGTITLTVSDGVIHWKSTSGRTGTVTLHEGDGKRVLIWTYDQNPKWSGESVPKSN